MQLASRQCLWKSGSGAVEIGVDAACAAYPVIDLYVEGHPGRNVLIDWGDGTERTSVAAPQPTLVQHIFMGRRAFSVLVRDLRAVGVRKADSAAHERSEPLVTSVDDPGGLLTGSMPGAFRYCANLRRFRAPACASLAGNDFAECTSLEEVVLGRVGVCGDGAFRDCASLASFSAKAMRACGRDVWRGCSSLEVLDLGDVDQLSAGDFADAPNLREIRIANRTVDQIRQAAASGNVAGGYGAAFPWGASAACRFLGRDGYALGDGTAVRQ